MPLATRVGDEGHTMEFRTAGGHERSLSMETISTRRSTCEIFTGSSAIRMRAAEVAFRQSYPAFENTSLLDELREREYARLDDQAHLYLDYTGGSLNPDNQLREHLELLRHHVFSTPPPSNPTSRPITKLNQHPLASNSHS